MVMLVAHTSLEEAGHWRSGPLHLTSNVFSVRGRRSLDDRLDGAALGGAIIRGVEYARASFALRLSIAAVLKNAGEYEPSRCVAWRRRDGPTGTRNMPQLAEPISLWNELQTWHGER